MFKIIGADGKEYGPVGADQIRRWLAEGRVNAQTQAWRGGMSTWLPLGSFPEFAPSLPQPFPSGSDPSRTPRTNSMALAGFIFAVLSITFGFCCCYGTPLNLLALVFSFVGLSQIRSDPSQAGKPLAIAGIVIALLSLIVGVILGLFYGLMVGTHHLGGRMYHL